MKTPRILRQILLTDAAHRRGIVPIDYSSLDRDFGRILSGLPPEEARKMKRKFRKLWRSAARANSLHLEIILQEGRRTRLGCRRRKLMVLRLLEDDVTGRLRAKRTEDGV